jgi:hypothetical protein
MKVLWKLQITIQVSVIISAFKNILDGYDEQIHLGLEVVENTSL